MELEEMLKRAWYSGRQYAYDVRRGDEGEVFHNWIKSEEVKDMIIDYRSQ